MQFDLDISAIYYFGWSIAVFVVLEEIRGQTANLLKAIRMGRGGQESGIPCV